MPLSNLFQRRNATKVKKNPSSESSKSTGDSTAKEQVTEVHDDPKTQIETSSLVEQLQQSTSLDEPAVFDNDSNNVQQQVPDRKTPSRESSISSDGSRKSSSSEGTDIKGTSRFKTRSLSCRVAEEDVPKTRRRKCESESGAYNPTEDEGYEDRVFQLRGKELEKVIEQCVDRLVRESIITAVKCVKVDDLCEEVMRNISERSHSQTSDYCATVEQKLHSKSVSEYADLEMVHTFEDGGVAKDANSESEQHRCEIPIGNKLPSGEPQSVDAIDGVLREGAPEDNSEEVTTDQYPTVDLHTDDELDDPTPEEGSSDDLVNSEEDRAREERSSTRLHSDAIQRSIELEMAKSLNDETLEDEPLAMGSSQIDLKEGSSSSDASINGEGEESTSPLTSESGDPKSASTRAKPVSNASSSEVVSDHSVNCTEQSSDGVREFVEKREKIESRDLMSADIVPEANAQSTNDPLNIPVKDIGENPPVAKSPNEEKKINWKVGYLNVKLPHKTRNKGHLKAWKKRCVAIHPDEFANDPKEPCLMISVYSGESGAARKHSASFWKSVSCLQATVYRSNSRTHPYAFTISDQNRAVVHLAADGEAISQEWMAAIRSILWPPSPVMQLEKMLNGSEFEISLIDNEFAYRAGLLGMYGYLTITQKKLILVHPQQGYVIQEWYLNTVDKFELMPQTRIEDVNKVLAMTTCSDSSTGKGEILIFCTEAVSLLQALASTIHQILTHHSKQEGGKYQKELEEIAEWLVPPTTDAEDYYKVPPRQVRSLLDIPNFIFDKPLTPVATVACSPGVSMETMKPSLGVASKSNPARASQDSGISSGTASDDFLNCSVTSFVVGGGAFPGKSSDSELSDAYTPPHSPRVRAKKGDSSSAKA